MTAFWNRLFGRNQAATWFARLVSGNIDRRTDRKWREWIDADARNEESFARLAESWESAAHVEHRPAANRWLLDVDALSAARASSVPRAIRSPWVAATAGFGALALIAVLFGLWRWQNSAITASFSTAIGEHRLIELPDQSKVDLNTATRIDARFTRRARDTTLLAGEALFDVRKDPSRPFNVHAAGGVVTAVGTRFAVQLMAEGRVDVAVLEGTVTVSHPRAGSRTVRLEAGQQVRYSVDGEFSAIEPADALRIEGWRRGRLVFQNKSLQDTLLEFNRYTPTPVVLESPELASRRFGGVFRTGETQAFLDALKATLDVNILPGEDRIIIRAKEPKSR